MAGASCLSPDLSMRRLSAPAAYAKLPPPKLIVSLWRLFSRVFKGVAARRTSRTLSTWLSYLLMTARTRLTPARTRGVRLGSKERWSSLCVSGVPVCARLAERDVDASTAS